MPRRRHDSSSEESDSSDMSGSKARPMKKHKHKGSRRPAAEHISDVSDEEIRSKSSKRGKRRETLSDAESSPVKKAVASKVEKSKDKDKKKKKDKGSKRPFVGEDVSPEKKRAKAGQETSPRDQRDIRGRNSPPVNRGPRGNDRPARRGDMNRSSDSGRGFRSPDRNRGRVQRQDERTIGDFLEPSPTNRGRDEGEFRGFDERGRGSGGRNEARKRSIDRPGDQRNFAGADRVRMRSVSPQERFGRTANDSWKSDDQNFDQRRNRSRSPNRRRDLNRSISPDRGNNNVFSPPSSNRPLRDMNRSTSIENGAKSSSRSKKSKNGKKKGANISLQASDSDIQSPVKEKKKKSSQQKRDDSVERSFERSKMSLSEENLHSGHLEEFNMTESPPKTKKKSKHKRRKVASGSESGSPDRVKSHSKSELKMAMKQTKKSKKSKSAIPDLERVSRSRSRSIGKNSEGSRKSGSKKKSSGSLQRNSLSRSPSPLNLSGKLDMNRSRSSDAQRASDLNRSRSTEVVVGRNHDMAKFESEPESGELTDSEDEGEKASRQALKSQIKKATEEDLRVMEDEKYWAEKRKASRRAEEESTGRGDARRDRERGSRRRVEEPKEAEAPAVEPAVPAPRKPKDGGVEALVGRTGGAYIPPARLRAMQALITDKSSVEYQRISWEALKKSINGLVNKVNVSNIEEIVRELFQENIVRGRGLLARSIIQAQAASPTFTHVYAALVAIVNTKFPQDGELVLKRLIQQFRRGFKRNDKNICMSSTRFVAHLVNQQVAHEVLALEILTLLLETATDDSVEVTIGFLKECGQKLTEVTPRGINAIFERLRNILHEGQIDTRVQYMVEVMFAVRKDGFKDNLAVPPELDLVEEEDQFTHLMNLEDVTDGEEMLNVFRPDPNFLESEEKYKVLKREILDEGSSDEDESGSGSGSEGSDDDSDNEAAAEKKQAIVDQTETNMVALRRTIYLTIQSSLDFEECAHKLMKMELKPGQEVELCNMILDCCAQMRTYEKFFGLLAGRFCMLDKKYVEPFQHMFQEQYGTIHRLETNKLRNVAKFFAHLLHTDSVSWAVLSCIKLNEEDTTSASRIFIKILFQELSEYLGLPKLNDRLKDVTLQEYYTGLMPRDNPRDTRFAINFFTTIGLGGLTDDLRDHLKSVSKKLMEQKQKQQTMAKPDDSDSSDASSSDGSESSSDDSSSELDSSDSEMSEDERKKKKKKKPVEKPKEVEKKKTKGKSRSEPEAPKDKRSRREKEKDKSNGAVEKLDKKKDKKDKKGKQSKEDPKKAMEDQFKRLAKLANYGKEVIEMADTQRREQQRKSSLEMDDRRARSANRGIRSPERGRDPYERESRRRVPDMEPFDLMDPRDRLGDIRGDRAEFDRRGNLDRGYDRFEPRDDRGRKGRDLLDDDRPVQVERSFARMDVYEDKFARERESNLEYLRGTREFEDYFRGRSDIGREMLERGEFRGPPRGRSGDRTWDDRRVGPSFDREFDRGLEEPKRRGRNRSEERLPVVRDERRRRR